MSIHLLTTASYDWVHLKSSFLKHVTSKSIVLEIGASTIERTTQIAKHVHKLIGVEYFTQRLPSNFANIEYRQGDWQELSKSIEPNSIDCAISSHVIEHVPDDLRALNELYVVLKPGATAVINTPNRQRLIRRIIEIFKGPKHFPDWEHIREYSYSDLNDLLNKSKFKKFTIIPIVFGLHTGKYLKFYSTSVPKIFTNFANYWEIELLK